MEKKEIKKRVKQILLKHEEHTSEGGIYWEYEWVGGKEIPDGAGGYRYEGGERVSAEEAFYKEMTDFIYRELDKTREEGLKDGIELEQLWNAEFFEEDYQDPERIKELENKYKLNKEE